METPDRSAARKLWDQYRKKREGIRNSPEAATICLICGSTHVQRKIGSPLQMVCANCGFYFYRYDCPDCGLTVDGRDPLNPECHECGQRVCTCGSCGCHPG
jgi:hypothetical protein